MDPLGIYISIPFCRSKCTYCNFASGVFPAEHQQRYIERVMADVRDSQRYASQLSANLPEAVDSIYLGGGTPSILAPDLLRRLFATLRGEFQVAPAAEITVECAPGQLEDNVLAAMAECGVNRVSFGVQSFIDREAAVTGRLHTRETALRDIERVRRVGIGSVNADLIAGLPYQTDESWGESLEVLIGSGVDHASVYMLEVDEDSRLGKELLDGGGRYHAGTVPSDEMSADFYSEAVETLRSAGLAQYEISNFAHHGSESVHNRKYWLRKPYLGFGLDAHSMLRGVDGDAIRFATGDDLSGFLDGASWQDVQTVARPQALEEAWFLGLRLNEGVQLAELEAEFGEAAAHRNDDVISELETLGFVEQSPGRVRLTDRGRLVSNEVFERLLSDEVAAEANLVLVD
jgi:oxygen-independent coproporphyrinogen III oxidase